MLGGHPVKIQAFPILLSEPEAYALAEKRGNFLGRLLIKKDHINLRLMYLESREIIFRMTYEPAPLPRLLGKKAEPKQTQRIRMLVEGTRGIPAYLGEEPQLEEVEIQDLNMVQNSELPDEKLIQEARYLARRMVRRQAGRTVTLEVEKMRSVYRPYYVAFYGELVEGTKVRYLPIAADKNEITRTF